MLLLLWFVVLLAGLFIVIIVSLVLVLSSSWSPLLSNTSNKSKTVYTYKLIFNCFHSHSLTLTPRQRFQLSLQALKTFAISDRSVSGYLYHKLLSIQLARAESSCREFIGSHGNYNEKQNDEIKRLTRLLSEQRWVRGVAKGSSSVVCLLFVIVVTSVVVIVKCSSFQQTQTVYIYISLSPPFLSTARHHSIKKSIE